MPENSEMDYVGFWPRAGATMIDTFLMLLISAPLMIAIYGRSYLLQDSSFLGPAHFMISYVLPVIVQVACWIGLSTTPGKMAIGAIIVDARTGNKPSPGQFIKRCFGYYLSAIPFFLGYFWVGFHSRKQGWHDMLADTVVIRRKKGVPSS